MSFGVLNLKNHFLRVYLQLSVSEVFQEVTLGVTVTENVRKVLFGNMDFMLQREYGKARDSRQAANPPFSLWITSLNEIHRRFYERYGLFYKSFTAILIILHCVTKCWYTSSRWCFCVMLSVRIRTQSNQHNHCSVYCRTVWFYPVQAYKKKLNC